MDAYLGTRSGLYPANRITQSIFKPTLTPSPTPTPNLGDLNNDGEVNILDLLEWRNLWAQGNERAELDGQDGINILDYLALLKEWLKS